MDVQLKKKKKKKKNLVVIQFFHSLSSDIRNLCEVVLQLEFLVVLKS